MSDKHADRPMRLSKLLAASVAVVIVLTIAPFGAVFAEGPAIDPATLSFVPVPLIIHHMMPTDQGKSCAGKAIYSPGHFPPAVRNVRLTVTVNACDLVGADIEWTINGVSYTATVNVQTAAVQGIHMKGARGLGLPTASAMETGGGGSTSSGGGGDSGSGSGGVTCTPWSAHTNLNMNTATGSEQVYANIGWSSCSDGSQTRTSWGGYGTTTGSWVKDSCDNTNRGNNYQTADCYFHSTNWPNDYHDWDNDISYGSDNSLWGWCTPYGDMPYNYQSQCNTGYN